MFFVFGGEPLTAEKTIDKTTDWQAFNRDTVAHYVILPDEVALVSAKYTDRWYLGEYWVVEFRLPNTRAPENWLATIAAEQTGYVVTQEAGLLSGRSPTGGWTWKVEYHAGSRSYIASGGWD